jgi:hypothetical protein
MAAPPGVRNRPGNRAHYNGQGHGRGGTLPGAAIALHERHGSVRAGLHRRPAVGDGGHVQTESMAQFLPSIDRGRTDPAPQVGTLPVARIL